ncbi:hypothetical protein [Fictibacillus barbaricus]|uniref:Cytochrome c assembly protein domain-containing protein n=1 Tax=Fictibacillus barbaricus TaxID=182136 RepID=A0ABU1U5C8_9BACL|nr:hypothetical protein [Fictibacillus barbaricus]MDR7074593.1 hypothetical protein [Fictibacillus barbaricus]
MLKSNLIFTKAEHSKYDYILHITFALLLCFYSFLILFSSKLLGCLFFISGLAILSLTVWKGIKTFQSVFGVIALLFLLFFSRLLWMNAFYVLPVSFYKIFQAVFFIEFAVGLALLYSLITKTAPFVGRKLNFTIHGGYFLTGFLLITYTWLYSYGAVMQGDYTKLVWSLLILILWSGLYTLQYIYDGRKAMAAALFFLNIGVGCWSFYRWIHIFT